jgi:hypothetical protein
VGTRQDEIVAEIDTAHRELVDLVLSATPEQWEMAAGNHPEIRAGEDEHRRVGVIVHHVATAHATSVLRCQSWLRDKSMPAPTAEDNARHEKANPAPDHIETMRLLNDNAAALKAYIQTLSDKDLEATGPFVRGDITVDRLLGSNTPYHIRWHAESIRTTWEKVGS